MAGGLCRHQCGVDHDGLTDIDDGAGSHDGFAGSRAVWERATAVRAADIGVAPTAHGVAHHRATGSAAHYRAEAPVAARDDPACSTDRPVRECDVHTHRSATGVLEISLREFSVLTIFANYWKGDCGWLRVWRLDTGDTVAVASSAYRQLVAQGRTEMRRADSEGEMFKGDRSKWSAYLSYNAMLRDDGGIDFAIAYNLG